VRSHLDNSIIDKFKPKDDPSDIWHKFQQRLEDQPGLQAEVFKKASCKMGS